MTDGYYGYNGIYKSFYYNSDDGTEVLSPLEVVERLNNQKKHIEELLEDKCELQHKHKELERTNNHLQKTIDKLQRKLFEKR